MSGHMGGILGVIPYSNLCPMLCLLALCLGHPRAPEMVPDTRG